jgi:hypothetical protein
MNQQAQLTKMNQMGQIQLNHINQELSNVQNGLPPGLFYRGPGGHGAGGMDAYYVEGKIKRS